MNEIKEISIEKLNVQTVPAVLSANFIEINKMLDDLLSEQVTLVTEETIKDEKKVLANLRKLAVEIDGKRKTFVEIVSVDINLFVDNMGLLKKKVLSVCDAKAKQITDLEQQTRDKCKVLLEEYLARQWDVNGVAIEYRKANIDGLIKISSLTDKGELTKPAKAAIEGAVKEDLARQARIASRLVELENRCLKAGIAPPLTRASIEYFLQSDDPVFYGNLDKIINAEIERKEEVERLFREKIEAEQKARLDAEIKKNAVQAEVKEEAKGAHEVAPKISDDKKQPNIADKLVAVDPGRLVDFKVTLNIQQSFVYKLKASTSIEKIKSFATNKYLTSRKLQLSDIVGITVEIGE